MNNARIKTMNRTVPVCNIKCYNEEHDIWTGEVIKDNEMQETLGHFVFFSRYYNSEENEMDQVLKEYHFPADDNVIGIEFWIIPSEKIIFLYEPASSILKPQLSINPKKRRRTQ